MSARKKIVSRVLLGILFIIVAAPFLVGFCNFDIKVNKQALDAAVASGSVPAEIYDGTRVVCFYSLKCPYCLRNAAWLERTRRIAHFKDVPLTVLFGQPSDPDSTPDGFLAESGLQFDGISYVDVDTFVDIVCGTWPLVLVMKDGRIIHKFTYREF